MSGTIPGFSLLLPVTWVCCTPLGPITTTTTNNYYSFKISPHFWLVKTTHIIHHNQLLMTKYWTNDIKSASCCKLLNQWHQIDIKSAARCRLLNRWPWGWGCVIIAEQKKQRAKGWNSSVKNGEIFWMNNKAIIQFGFRRCYPPRPPASVDNTLLDLQNSSYPTQPHSTIANNNNNNNKNNSNNNNNNNNNYNNNNNNNNN